MGNKNSKNSLKDSSKDSLKDCRKKCRTNMIKKICYNGKLNPCFLSYICCCQFCIINDCKNTINKKSKKSKEFKESIKK